MHRNLSRRAAFLVPAVMLASAALAAPALASPPTVHERYASTDSGTEEVCGEEWSFEATSQGIFTLKGGKQGDVTPFFVDNYDYETTYTDPQDPSRGFIVSGNGNFKDLHVTLISGTIYRIETIDVGQPTRILTLDGRVVARDSGRYAWDFLVDTHGSANPDDFELVDARIASVSGPHPLLDADDDAFCGYVAEAIGD